LGRQDTAEATFPIVPLSFALLVQSLRWEFGRASIAFLSFLSDLVCFVFGDKYFPALQALGLAFIFPLFLCFSCNSFFLRCLMDKDSECNAVRQVLEERCPGAKFRGDDIKKLVDAGYDTETALAAASKDSLDRILSTRPGVVDVLVKSFSQPGTEETLARAVLTPQEHGTISRIVNVDVNSDLR
jgi:hypothetical protein